MMERREQFPIVRNFAASTVRDIERNHGMVFDPFEASLARLVSIDAPFWFITNRENADFMNLQSRPTQIAIFPEPEKFYVPDSNKLSLSDQRKLLKVDELEVVQKIMRIGGFKEVIGDVATHAALVFACYVQTGHNRRLHGRDGYGYRLGSTDTTTVGSRVASVGHFHGVSTWVTYGLHIYDWDRDRGDAGVWAVRMLVPAQE